MIVIDSNVLAYSVLPGEHRDYALRLVLVTSERRLAKAFPDGVMLLHSFTAARG